jgi:hypothetical protein
VTLSAPAIASRSLSTASNSRPTLSVHRPRRTGSRHGSLVKRSPVTPAAACDPATLQAFVPADTTIVAARKLGTDDPYCRADGYVISRNPVPEAAVVARRWSGAVQPPLLSTRSCIVGAAM